jgi:phosphate:Na+ symporter
LLVSASKAIDGVTLLAAYHTAYNVVGVLVLLPVIDRFTRLVERILPERASPLTRYLDPSALETPTVAVEAVRRLIARALEAVCGSVEAALARTDAGAPVRPRNDAITVPEAAAALRQAQVFLSDVTGPPYSDDEQQHLTSTLHALDHATRLAETANGKIDFGTLGESPDDTRAGGLCAEAMRSATAVAGDVGFAPALGQGPRATAGSPGADATPGAVAASSEQALVRLERSATELKDMQRSYRGATLGAVANGTLSADAAFVRVDTVRSLEALAHHAWRSAAHLVGRSG